MIKREKASVVSFGLLCGLLYFNPAFATQSIRCTDMKFDSNVDILLGSGPVPNVLAVTLSIGERRLTTVAGQPGEKISKAQSYDDGEFLRIDLVDDQATKRMVVIRLVRSRHNTHPLQIGIVQIEDEVPIGLTCEGP